MSRDRPDPGRTVATDRRSVERRVNRSKRSMDAADAGPGARWIEALGPRGLARFRAGLLAWYRPRGRPLRIRETRDPWAILVAEVMAQQTQIARVDEAWVVFMELFPTPGRLAAASTSEVLRAWSGLGYNRRAVALQRAATLIESDHAGRVPDDLDALMRLPGVGPYTARAVAAVAYGRPVAAVDTNVRRVISRLVGSAMSPAALQAAADLLCPRGSPAAWTHASMDLGATVCTARRPQCDICPVRRWCSSAGRVIVGDAARARTRARKGSPAVPFEQTSRWLRGRIVAVLRDADEGAWTRLPPAIGDHGPGGVGAAIAALERDGLLERRSDGAVRLPSSQP